MSQHEHEVRQVFQIGPRAEQSYRFAYCDCRQVARVVPIAHRENGRGPSGWEFGEPWRKPNREEVLEMEAWGHVTYNVHSGSRPPSDLDRIAS